MTSGILDMARQLERIRFPHDIEITGDFNISRDLLFAYKIKILVRRTFFRVKFDKSSVGSKKQNLLMKASVREGVEELEKKVALS